LKVFTKILLLSLYILFYCSLLSAQTKYSFDYYGIMADGVDDNMSKMTSDLYYTQLSEINNYIVSDKRESIKLIPFNPSALSGGVSGKFYLRKKHFYGKRRLH
jgi:hypothetical protein